MILDLMKPILDGPAVCPRLKSKPLTADIRIVIVAGRDDQNDRLLGSEFGADDYIEKPACPAYVTRSVSGLSI